MVENFPYFVSESASLALEGKPFGVNPAGLNPRQLMKLKAWLHSLHWRSNRMTLRPMYLILLEEEKTIEAPEKFNVMKIEDEIEKAERLSFTDKCFCTLENLVEIWNDTGTTPRNQYFANNEAMNWFISKPGVVSDGVTYGCEGEACHLVYRWLMTKGYLTITEVEGRPKPELTAEALIEVDRIKQGKESSLKSGFFIRAWDPQKDEFFKPILDQVKNETGCEISPVWQKAKNGKLDEIIFRSIREASVILLDVTGPNSTEPRFNVGLEAGYALALRKQVILICDKQGQEKNPELPFDIRTWNCHFYQTTSSKALQEILVARVNDALEEAKLSSQVRT